MKKILLLSFLSLSLTFHQTFGVNKYALIIAISKYSPKSRIASLSSANDIPLIKNALLKESFKDENIRIIQDVEATKNLIVNAIKDLISKVNQGDIVVFHYSGHGIQVVDQNGDELDGFDEAFVPYNGMIQNSSKGIIGQNLITDDEFGVLMNAIRAKIGKKGQLIIIADSCFSGTITRDASIITRTVYKAQIATSTKEMEREFEKEKQTTVNILNEFKTDVKSDVLAPMITMSATKPDECNYEIIDKATNKGCGSLSYAFSKAILSLKRDISYRGLFDIIKSSMAVLVPEQTPMIEGDVNLTMFGGGEADRELFYKFKKSVNDTLIIFDAGTLSGINPGTEVDIYPAGTSPLKKEKPFARGTVSESSEFESALKLDKPIASDKISQYWIFVTKKNFGKLSVAGCLNFIDKKLQKNVQEKLKNYPIINIVDLQPDVYIDEKKPKTGENRLIITTRTNDTLYQEPLLKSDPEDIAKTISSTLMQYSRMNYLKNLELSAPNLNVKFEVLPVKYKKDGKRLIVTKILEPNRVTGDLLQYNIGTPFIIRIINRGEKEAYFSIVYIQSNNSVDVLLPLTDQNPIDYKVAPKDTMDLKSYIFAFNEPCGKDFFKMIASSKPIEIRDVISTSQDNEKVKEKIKTRGSDPFEVMMYETMNGTRGAALNVSTDEMSISTMVIKVVK